jgi:hypothetical protein
MLPMRRDALPAVDVVAAEELAHELVVEGRLGGEVEGVGGLGDVGLGSLEGSRTGGRTGPLDGCCTSAGVIVGGSVLTSDVCGLE